MAFIQCKGCGTMVSEQAAFCPKCGHPINGNIQQAYYPQNTNQTSAKSRTTTALLALFLGGIGIHYFYIGKPVAGVVFLLFFWLYIPALLSFVQAIIMFTMTDEQFNQKYVATTNSFPLF